MPTFVWIPSFEIEQQKRPRVLRSQFGDGYQQRTVDGLNANPNRFPLTFQQRDQAEADAIMAFLDNAAGAANFDWTPPGGVAGKYICPEYSRIRKNAAYSTINAIFEQVSEV